ncbi:MAG: thiosulfohydrolase SoxB, partial [Acetobacteraceae bacterium]|nr:thiosulfohydrolase SoxB [Acetobacteraceae bacterium]
GSARAYALTCLDFDEAAHRYGRLGGFAHIKTLVDRLRDDAGPANTLLLDGGDLWQGSWPAHRSKGAVMVDLANQLGIDAMTAHWEFTYGESDFRKTLAGFKGAFLAQNVFLTDDAAFNGAAAFDAQNGRVFTPSMIREIGGRRLAVIGQCFPYQPIAHPRRLVPDWTFGIREAELQKVVDEARDAGRADAVLLLSHSGMDVDLKLASRVRGIDVILGGHTHDCTPAPTVVTNPGGRTLVTSGGSNGKFIAVLDLDVGQGRVNGLRYTLVPIFSNLLKPDPGVAAAVAAAAEPDRAMLGEKLAPATDLLFRRGNFSGTMDRVICDALLQQLGAQIALSPGFRWGPTQLAGEDVTMGFVLAHTALTYPDVYVQEMTGEQLKGVLEDVCDNLFNPDPYVQQGGDMVRVGGMAYTCSPAEKIGNRISDMVLSDGSKLEAGKTYRVAGWASVNLEQTGKPVWEVVAAHLRAAKGAAPAGSDGVRVRGVDGNPGYLEAA